MSTALLHEYMTSDSAQLLFRYHTRYLFDMQLHAYSGLTRSVPYGALDYTVQGRPCVLTKPLMAAGGGHKSGFVTLSPQRDVAVPVAHRRHCRLPDLCS